MSANIPDNDIDTFIVEHSWNKRKYLHYNVSLILRMGQGLNSNAPIAIVVVIIFCVEPFHKREVTFKMWLVTICWGGEGPQSMLFGPQF
jgi:hypothetical protein